MKYKVGQLPYIIVHNPGNQQTDLSRRACLSANVLVPGVVN